MLKRFDLISFLIGMLVMYLITSFSSTPTTVVFDQVKKNEAAAELIEQKNDSLIQMNDSIMASTHVEEIFTAAEQELIEGIHDPDTLISAYHKHRPEKTTGDVIEIIDSSFFRIAKDEAKYIIKKYIDYNFLKNIKVRGLQKIISNQSEIIAGKDSIISLRDDSIELLKEEIIDLTPTWLEKWTPYLGGVLIAILFIWLSR